MRTTAFGGQHDHARSEREFARARRHSRLVSVLKIGLPLVAVVIVLGGSVVTWLARALPDNVSVTSASLDDGRIVMENPRMTGFDKNGRPYSMIADRAIQTLGSGGVDLEGITANLTVRDGETADILAAKGHFDQTAQTLRLYDDITVDTSDGMSVKLKEAQIDLAAGDMVGVGPVDIAMPNQTIAAGAMTVRDNGQLLGFANGVKMTILPSAATAAAPAPPESN